MTIVLIAGTGGMLLNAVGDIALQILLRFVVAQCAGPLIDE